MTLEAISVANKFLQFSHKIKLILANLFIEKGHAVNGITMDNEKCFRSLCLKAEAWLK